jgi:hypothetical protein
VNSIVCFDKSNYGLNAQTFTYNKSSHFVRFLNEIASEYQRDWFDSRKAVWNRQTVPKFTETIVRHGIGYSFNMINADDWLNFDS